MSRLADAVLLARLIEELVAEHWEEAAQVCSSALDGTFDVEAAKARLRELRPIRDPDDELDRLAGALPMIKRAEVVKVAVGTPCAMIVASDEPLCARTHARLHQWCEAANQAMGWNIKLLVLEGKAARVSFVEQAELPPSFKPEPN